MRARKKQLQILDHAARPEGEQRKNKLMFLKLNKNKVHTNLCPHSLFYSAGAVLDLLHTNSTKNQTLPVFLLLCSALLQHTSYFFVYSSKTDIIRISMTVTDVTKFSVSIGLPRELSAASSCWWVASSSRHHPLPPCWADFCRTPTADRG